MDMDDWTYEDLGSCEFEVPFFSALLLYPILPLTQFTSSHHPRSDRSALLLKASLHLLYSMFILAMGYLWVA